MRPKNLLRANAYPTCAALLQLALTAFAVGVSEPIAAAQSPAAELESRPLQAPAAASGAALFAAVSSEQTGIAMANAYDDPRMWRERYHEFGVGSIGSGAAIGDFDKDGLADLFVVSKLESCRLFRNLGDWKFEDITEQAGVGDDSRHWKQGVACADIDNDGWLDLYVCRFDAPNLLFMNQGDGTFAEEAAPRGLALVDACVMAAFEDYDRDGWLDVYIQTNLLDAAAKPQGQRDYLLRNNGAGVFTDVTAAAGIENATQGHSATWWDFNDDGWPDIYVANDFAEPDYLYKNNGDGTFSNALGHAVPHTPFSSMGADFGDVNNDGRIDFLVADMAMTSHEMDQRGQADSRAKASEPHPGHPDKAIQLPRNTLFLNTGAGRCLETAYSAGLDATDWTWSVRFEDLDNDGWIDLHVTNGMNREQNNVDVITSILRSETAVTRVQRMRAAPILNQANLAFRNLGNGRFEEVGSAWGLDETGVSFGAAFGDLDNDGDLDLVYTNYQKSVSIFRNEGQSGARVTVALRGAASNRFGIGAVITIESALGRQTRRLGQARGYLSTSEPIAHFGLGADERVDALTVRWPSGRSQTFRDLASGFAYTVTEPNNDRETWNPRSKESRLSPRFEDVTAATGLGLEAEEELREGTVAQPLLTERFNRRGPAIVAADLNGDGIEEIIMSGTTLQPARILLRSGERYELDDRQTALRAAPVNEGPPLVFDANGDGAMDLLLTAGGAAFPAEDPEYEPRLFLNDGQGVFEPAPPLALPSAPISAGAACAADFDRDGREDLFIGGRVLPGFYPEAPVSVLLVNRGGRFENATDQWAPEIAELGMITAALANDVDGDGWTDLIVALDWGGIRYFRNSQGKSFEDRSVAAGFAAAGSGWWSALAAADFNEDGRADYVAGNRGLNTQFQPSPEQPEMLYWADFAASGQPQIIAAYFEGGRLLPRASRRELAAAIPAVMKRFPRNDDFAKATLPEILGHDALAQAQHLRVTECRSGVFLSQADGGFRFQPLPHLAQIAPIQSLVADDFDGDGHYDIVATQNAYAPAPSVGRFDGGLGCWLRGDGKGGFRAVPPAESGFVVPGDAKGLAGVDFDADGYPDLIATRNNAPALAFRNRGGGE